MSSVALALRPLEFFLTQYKRVWRGTAVTSVVTPVVYLLALGVGLGVFVDRSTNLSARRLLPRVRRARAHGRDGDAARVVRGDLPVFSAIKWDRQYHAMLATPVARARRHARPSGVLRVPARSDGDGLLRRHHRFRRGRLAARRARDPGHGSRRARRSRRRSPPGRRTRRSRSRSSRSSGSSSSRCSSSRGRSSRSRRLPAPLEVIAWFTPLWHGVTLCRDLTLGDRRRRTISCTSRISSRAWRQASSLARITYRTETHRLMTRARRTRSPDSPSPPCASAAC